MLLCRKLHCHCSFGLLDADQCIIGAGFLSTHPSPIILRASRSLNTFEVTYLCVVTILLKGMIKE